MSSERGTVPIDPELNAIADALGSIVPSRSRLDRDRVMFRAGQASRPTIRGRRFWPAAAACLGLIASAEAALLAYRPGPRVVERLVVVREPAAASPEKAKVDQVPGPPAAELAPGWTDRERLAGQVLRYGLDGLPASPTARWGGDAASPSPSRSWMQEQLRKSLDNGDPS